MTPITYRGRKYSSIAAAARANGIRPGEMYARRHVQKALRQVAARKRGK